MGQWGFRAGRSTEVLLIHLTETGKQTLDNSQVVGAVYIDFQKAFDTVYYFEMVSSNSTVCCSGGADSWRFNGRVPGLSFVEKFLVVFCPTLLPYCCTH